MLQLITFNTKNRFVQNVLNIRFTILVLVSTLILTSMGITLDSFAQSPNEESQIHATDRLIIKFYPGVSQEIKNSIISGQSSTVLSDLVKMDVKIIKVPEQALDSVKQALSKNQNVEYAEYDIAVPPTVIANDPSYGSEWFLTKINSEGAWDVTKGSTYDIAILDSGIDMDHPDLQSKIINPYNALTLTATPVDHQNGCTHGTPVAGSAAAITNNGVGVAGVGWDTQIIPIKITDDSSTGSTQCYGWSSGVLNGVYWAVEKGARVVNLSYGFGSGTGQIDTAAQYMQNNGGWLVISAGNSGGFSSDPDNYKVINVASTTSSDTRSSFSTYGQLVDISGPGSSIYTTLNGGYGSVSGTSFSAPITASVLNLIFSVNPSLTAGEAYTILLDTSVDLGDPGWDQYFGAGRVDAQAAVQSAADSLVEPVPPNFKVAFIGDQGSNSNSEAVLQLISNENADMVLHQGDFDYGDNPTVWNNQINTFLGPAFPYFASVGNHDLAQWSGYQQKLQERLNLVPGAVCTGDLGVNSSCHYQGLFFILSGVGTLGSGHETYIQNQLAADDSVWSICSWHKNQNAMQVGGKGNEVGWGAYDACRQGGAIIATAHEHSYERTKTLTSTTNQVVDPAWTNPNEVRVAEGSTFAFVSGLGGQSIRDQLRCTPTNYPYGCNGEWASIYTISQGAQSGALFCEFNVNGQEDKATCYFKNTSGQIVDTFNITSFMGVDIPQEPPVSYNQSLFTYENIPIDITLSATDANGDSLTYSIVSDPTNGSLFGIAPNLTYTPNSDYAGSDSFTFKANDGTVDSNTATVSITVNSIPASGTLNIRVDSSSDDAEQQIASGIMDIPSTDIEVGDDPGKNENQLGGLRFQDIVVPQGATISSAYIEFETDEVDTVSTSVIISAQDHDNPPTFTTALNNISDRTTTTASVSWNNIPSWNTVSEKHNTPDISSLLQEVVDRPGWNPGNNIVFIIDGTGSRTAESYDGESANAALLHIEYTTLTPNIPPTANAGADQNVDEDSSVPLDGTASFDSDGTIATFAWTQTVGTTVTLTGAATVTPSFTAPSVGSSGETLTFSLIVTDNEGASSTADTVDINVADVPLPNNPPVADPQSVSSDEDSPLPITLTASDDDGNPLTFSVVASPSNGSLSGTEPNLTYAPNSNFNGNDIFTFKANDGTGDSNIATVSITVNSINDVPVAGPQSVSTDEDTSLPIALTASDVDGDPLTFTVLSNPPNGSLSGTVPNLTYTPNSGFDGNDSFTFFANDGTDDSNIATVSITVNPINEIHLEDITAESNTKKNWKATVTLTVFDSSDGPFLGAIVSGTWQGGPTDNCTTDLQGQCQVSNTSRAASQTFTVDDISGSGINYNSSANHMGSSITINQDGTIAGNTPPVADNQSVLTIVNTPLGITLSASDADGDSLTYSIVSGPSNGSLSGTEPALTYTNTLNFEGPDSFTFRTNDGTDDSNLATISINVTPINDPPVANDDFTSTDEDSSTNVVVLSNDSDPDGDSFSISTFDGTSSEGASISDNGDGTFTYDPTTSSTLQSLNDGQNQNDTFSYTIEDEHGSSDSALVTVTVSGSDDAPSTLSITSINPNSITRGSTDLVIQIVGTGFSELSTMSLENGGGPIPTITNTTFQNPGLIQITIDISSNGPKNTIWDLRVNDAGESAVLSGALNITK